MSYKEAFPDFPGDAIPQLPEGFVDWSWRNDVCPVFVDEVLGTAIWVDFPDEDAREVPGGSRYVVTTWTDEDGYGVTILQSDEWPEVQAHLRQLMREHVRQLGRRTATGQ